jgi:hypothetical protein
MWTKTKTSNNGSRRTVSGVRRAGRPQPGAPGSRPRIGGAAAVLVVCDRLSQVRLSSCLSALRHYPFKSGHAKRLRMLRHTLYAPFRNSLSGRLHAVKATALHVAIAIVLLSNGTGSFRRSGCTCA